MPGESGFMGAISQVWFTVAGVGGVTLWGMLQVRRILLRAAFYVMQLYWWSRTRQRSGVHIGYALLALVCGALTLSLANDHLGGYDGNATIHLIPVWATIVLAAVTILVHAVSRQGFHRMATDDLAEESRAMLLRERESALRVLAERGMLSAQDVATLSERPLGKLHDQEDVT